MGSADGAEGPKVELSAGVSLRRQETAAVAAG
jgi:hypothetical protein